MRSIGSIWLLVMCLLWQGFALAGSGGRMSSPADVEHEAMHRSAQLHHHGVDGKILPDDSVVSLLHALADVGSTASVLSLTTLGLLQSIPVVPSMLADDIPAAVCLDAPRRPPKRIV